MTINQMIYFLAVADHSSFTAAARTCYTSQPNLSRQILAIENELDKTLLIRSKHTVRLTAEGEVFYRYCSEIIRQYRMMLEDIQKTAGPVSLRFGMINGFKQLTSAVKKWSALNKKKYRIQLIHAGMESFLEDDKIDLGLTLLMQESEPNSLLLFTHKARPILPKFLWASETRPQMDDLRSIPVSIPSGRTMAFAADQLSLVQKQFQIHEFPCIVFDFETYLLNLLSNGCAGFMVNDDLGKYKDEFLVLDIPEITLELYIGLKWKSENARLCKAIGQDIAAILKEQPSI